MSLASYSLDHNGFLQELAPFLQNFVELLKYGGWYKQEEQENEEQHL